MRVLLAPDKFKGCLTAAEVVTHLGRGFAARGVAFDELPLADGGDGSVAAARHAGLAGVEVTVDGPTGGPHSAMIAFDGRTAVIEVANTCGLALRTESAAQPLAASSLGFGQAVRAALALGATRLVLALGGSASTDGGTGLLQALGMVFRDAAGAPLPPCGGTLSQITSVDVSSWETLPGIDIVVASDVQNPLTGPAGAAAVYAPQKGASPQDVRILEAGLTNLVRCLASADVGDAARLSHAAGAGSAGGLGFAGLLLGGELVSGADFFLDLLDFDARARACDLVVTGEGRLDGQTAQGKLVAVVARRAAGVPVIAVVGRNDAEPAQLEAMGITAVYALADCTDRDAATDPQLSASLLTELARTFELSR